MFGDDFDELVKQVERERRALVELFVLLLFVVAAAVVIMVTITGCARPDMTDREAKTIVELLRR